jgi:hypothetical protein
MGGFGSGRSGGRPLADTSLRVEIGWMLRTGRAEEGAIVHGSLLWHRGGQPSGSIGYKADLSDPDCASLQLSYTRGKGDEAVNVEQRIRLSYTRPNYGGRRWWMICPYCGQRVLKLYLPPGGDRFASACAWRLSWQSQRIAPADRPFEAMFRLQRKLGGHEGFEAGLARKPMGMWRRTYERHWNRYTALDDVCSVTMAAMMLRLRLGAAGGLPAYARP